MNGVLPSHNISAPGFGGRTQPRTVSQPVTQETEQFASLVRADGGFGARQNNGVGQISVRGGVAPQPAADTPRSIAEKLLAAYAPPSASAANGVVSTDPGVFINNAYIRQLNLSNFERVTNQQNQQAWDNYQVAMKNWALNEDQRRGLGLTAQAPPAPPQYVGVDLNAFGKWWNQYNDNLAAGTGAAPPASDFLKTIASIF